MAFDWLTFLDSVGIEYVDRGPNVSRGHVNIRCPLCGDDPSEHLGLRLEDAAWGCFRDPQHRGKSPIRLIRALTGWTYDKAKEAVGRNEFAEQVDPEELAKRLEGSELKEVFKPVPLKLPKDFRRFDRNPSVIENGFHNYLEGRGFKPALEAAWRYNLRWAVTGRWKQRLILPITFHGEVMGWTARARVKATIRYDTYPHDETMRHLLYNYDRTRSGGEVLFIVEGPLDALKLDWVAYKTGSVKANCVALMGLVLTPGKLKLVNRLRDNYDRLVLLLDRGAEGVALDLQEALSFLDSERWDLPSGVEDPGELDFKGFKRLLNTWL